MGSIYKYGSVQVIPLEKIVPSPFQVRKYYGEIPQLAMDIEKRGLLQPILVRPIKEKYEIVHGHRRYEAVKSLGRTFIEAFVKELRDIEAILILGSENLQRKNFDPIEEGIMYKFYREFTLKETGITITCEEIAEAFNCTYSNVDSKLALLDLPQTVQEKIIKGDIPVRKVAPLTVLTKEVAYQRAGMQNFTVGPHKERTDRFYSEIEILAEEIEKGSKGGLRTREGVQIAVDIIQEGKTIEEALETAKLKESIQLAKEASEKGKSPKEIITEIIKSQQDPQIILDATVKLNIELTRKLLQSGTLKCPFCGKVDCLHWSCKGVAVIDGDKEKN